MNTPDETIYIATRGSTLALAQANLVLERCRAAFPRSRFDIKIIKTTGDKLQTASLANPGQSLPKGLFTKELEVALLQHQADMAVHSLKDLPTELPHGLTLGAVTQRADVRDVLVYRDAPVTTAGRPAGRGFAAGMTLADFPRGAAFGTSSNRRKMQLLDRRPDFTIHEIRGNVITRLQKLSERADLDVLVLAAAGLERLDFRIHPDGRLTGDAVPDGLRAVILSTDDMLPCVGQGALGIEIRENDARIEAVCAKLNHEKTRQAVTAERAFLRAMGGGCQSPVGGHAEIVDRQLRLRAVSFRDGTARRAEGKRPPTEAAELGRELAESLK